MNNIAVIRQRQGEWLAVCGHLEAAGDTGPNALFNLLASHDKALGISVEVRSEYMQPPAIKGGGRPLWNRR